MKSRMPGFYKLSPDERLKLVGEFSKLNAKEVESLKAGGLKLEQANHMIENVVGKFEIPLGIATNFLINGVDRLIPMATEEPSVVAAASNAARIARKLGGFISEASDPIMIGQIQVVNVKDKEKAKKAVLKNKLEILRISNEQDPGLLKHGGGARDLEVRFIESERGDMFIVHLLVDCRDAMGANAVNTMAEAAAPYIEEITKGNVHLKIISNLAVHRIGRARAIFSGDELGDAAVEGILSAYAFAKADPFRCATHNKGIMNGVSAVVLATGNDTRAIEAGAHAYASYKGSYHPLTRFEKNEVGDLVGEIEIPVAVGVVGGVTAVHPVAKINKKILNVKTSLDFGTILASVGLAQNFAALLALSTEGIQKGHMKLHARNLAVMAGSPSNLVEEVAEKLWREKKIRLDRAVEIVEEMDRDGRRI
jgi:hydroxymethylglutaryl-CoA reductase